MSRPHRSRTTLRAVALALAPFLALACADGGDTAPDASDEAVGDEATAEMTANSVARLLADDQPVFGIFSGQKSREGGMDTWAGQHADFQLYSMESGPFDVETMRDEFMAGVIEAGGEGALAEFPIIVRTPAIHTAPDEIVGMVDDAMGAGIAGIVFPHVTTADEAARSAQLIAGTEGVNILIVEDREGIGNVRDIVATPGVDVVFAGPGDLRRAFEGDMEAVENAIQTVLAACLEFDVPCGVTAGVDDIGERLDQGFEVIIVTEPEAVDVGMEHAGR